MHLLDTDTLTHLQAKHPKVVERLHRLDDSPVGTTIVTRIEMLRGRFEFLAKAATGEELLRAQQLLDRTEESLAQVLVVPFTEACARRFDDLRIRRELRRIGRADLLIACIALAHRAVLVTRNTRHFGQVPGLQTVNWVD
ncbi:MAG: PIN domain-containing protein [Planctomycetota bacterium]